jgi:hypothetical protein
MPGPTTHRTVILSTMFGAVHLRPGLDCMWAHQQHWVLPGSTGWVVFHCTDITQLP